jgi:hypothetical protein
MGFWGGGGGGGKNKKKRGSTGGGVFSPSPRTTKNPKKVVFQGAKRLEKPSFWKMKKHFRSTEPSTFLECPQDYKRKFKVTTDSNHAFPIAENVLNREFKVTEP